MGGEYALFPCDFGEDLFIIAQGRRNEKIVGRGLKGTEGETHIWVDGRVLLEGEASQKL